MSDAERPEIVNEFRRGRGREIEAGRYNAPTEIAVRVLVQPWRPFGRLPRPARWSVKCALFGLLAWAVLFPSPVLCTRQIRTLWDPSALVDPNAPSLRALRAEFDRVVPWSLPPAAQLRATEAFVCRHVPYAYDWETWNVLDFWPTVEQTLVQGREDCDGRAAVAASLLAGRGFEPRLACDLVHVWVETRHGPCMGPRGRSVLATTPDGRRKLVLPGLAQLGEMLAFGVRVFPLTRQIILVAAAMILLQRPSSGIGSGWMRVAAPVLALLGVRAGAGLGQDEWLIAVAAAVTIAAIAAGIMGRLIPASTAERVS